MTDAMLIKKKFCIWSLSLLTLVACSHTNSAPTSENYDLYLLIGQSNMAGRGTIEKEDTTPHPRVFMLNKDDKWVVAIDPIHFDKPERIGTGLGLSFGKAMAQADPGARIGLIPSAVGGTTIAHWQSGARYAKTNVNPYDDAVKRGLSAVRKGELKAILWHQGEYDSNAEKVPLYKDALIDLAARLRQDLNAPDLPFVVGGLGAFLEERRPSSVQINSILTDCHNFISNCHYVSAEGLKDKGDNLHFNSESYRLFGRRYANAVLDLQLSR